MRAITQVNQNSTSLAGIWERPTAQDWRSLQPLEKIMGNASSGLPGVKEDSAHGKDYQVNLGEPARSVFAERYGGTNNFMAAVSEVGEAHRSEEADVMSVEQRGLTESVVYVKERSPA